MDDVYLKPCPRCGGDAVSGEAISFSTDWGKGIHCAAQRHTGRLAMTPTERPILFSAEMVRAILAGTKSQTRRVIKPQPDEPVIRLLPRTTYAGNVLWSNVLGTGKYVELDNRKCPYGKPGDRLWVRETWCPVDDTKLDEHGEQWVDYKATPRYAESHPAGWDNEPDSLDALKWKSPMFMPRWASRITLEVVEVRVQRVQDISEEDAIAEGCRGGKQYLGHGDFNEIPPSAEFRDLWDSINAKRGYSFESNPWIWCISFRRVD